MRPLLLGMNNPRDPDPSRALAPSVAGTAGSRLFALVRAYLPDLDAADYGRALDRENLIYDPRWSIRAGRRAGVVLRRRLDAAPDRVVVPLGREVRDALLVPREWGWVLPWRSPAGWTARCLPHPSGLNRWYNDPVCRLWAGMMLAELAAASLREQDLSL